MPLQVEKRKMLNCVTLWFRGCIRNSKFGRRRRYRHHHEGNHAGTRVTMTDESVLGPGGLADQRKDTTGRNRQNDEWSPVAALEDTKPIFEDAEGTSARASRTTGGTYDDTSTLV